MNKDSLINELKQKHPLEVYVDRAITESTRLPILLEIIETDKTALKFFCEKIIHQVSQRQPGLLYPYFERMAALTHNENNFIKWGFIQSLPNLLVVDQAHKWPKVNQHFLALLDSPSVVTYGSAVAGIPKIVRQYPQYEPEYVSKLLKVDQHTFLYKGEVSPECQNVSKAHIIDCFTQMYPDSKFKQQILSFVQANRENPRKQVRQKAARFLKNHS